MSRPYHPALRGIGCIVSSLVVAVATLFLGACGNDTSIPRLTSLTVNPKTSTVALGSTAKFTAIGTYDNGTKKDVSGAVTWKLSDSKVGNVTSSGLVTPGAAGQLTITASMGSTTASATLSVSNAAIASLRINASSAVIPLGLSGHLTATAIYTNGSSRDVTDTVIWSSGAPNIAAVNQTGLVSTKSCGSVVVAAASGNAHAAATLTVAPANLVSIAVGASVTTILVGATAQLSATGTFSDGSSQDITTSVTWQSAAPRIANVDSAGEARGMAVGTSVIAATAGAITGSARLAVAAATLQSITVKSPSASVPVGTTIQLTAIGTFSDGTTQDLSSTATWQSASAQIVSVSPGGAAVALAVGSSIISATSGTISGSTLLTVSPAALTGTFTETTSTASPLGAAELTALQAQCTFAMTLGSGQGLCTCGSGEGMTTSKSATTYNGMTGSGTATAQPVLSVNYFSIPETTDSDADTTLRITDSATSGSDICAMVYVFDQDQQLTECCGCVVSDSGLLSLSLEKDLTSNPLTGVRSTTGVVKVVPADHVSNPSCNAGSITPSGTVTSWSTHAQSTGTSTR